MTFLSGFIILSVLFYVFLYAMDRYEKLTLAKFALKAVVCMIFSAVIVGFLIAIGNVQGL